VFYHHRTTETADPQGSVCLMNSIRESGLTQTPSKYICSLCYCAQS